MSNRAVILAGGQGTRLRPYSIVIPKPLVPIGDLPILEIIIRQLVASGFERITVAMSQKTQLVQTFFGDGSKWGADIDYTLETEPLGTMGPLTLIEDAPENFLILNGDILTKLDMAQFFESHVRTGNMLTIAATTRNSKVDYGVLTGDSNGNLIAFEEKPTSEIEVSMGIYAANKSIVAMVPKGEFYGFDQLVLDLLSKGEKVGLHRYSGYWRDIGRPEDYQAANDEFESMGFGSLGD